MNPNGAGPGCDSEQVKAPLQGVLPPPGEPLWQAAGMAAHPVGTCPEGWMVLPDVAWEPLPSLPTLIFPSSLTTQGPSLYARSSPVGPLIPCRP